RIACSVEVGGKRRSMKKTRAAAVSEQPERAAGKPRTTEGRKRQATGFAKASDIEAIVAGTHGDPFAVLGIQAGGKGFVARCFIPHAQTVEAFTLGGEAVGALARRHDEGFFEGAVTVSQRQP